MNALFRRLRYLLNRRRFDDELAGDLEFHREMAAREGRHDLGNSLRLREEAREAWGWMWIERLLQDLRYAVRVLRKSPGFTLAAVITLAVGIGVNVAAFGFFNLMVFRSLPVRDPDTMLRFQRRAAHDFSSDLPYPEMAFFREHSRTLSAVLAATTAKVTVDGEEKALRGHFVTANFLSDLGATARVGRLLDPAVDEAPGADPVVVLGDRFWQRRFAADPSIAGRVIRINGKPVTIIGVVSNRFGDLTYDTPDLWMPLTEQPYLVHGSQLLTDFTGGMSGVIMWGRLQPGRTPKVAEDELRQLAAELRKQQPTAIWENERLASEPGGYAQNGSTHRGDTPPRTLRQEIFPIFALITALVLLILAVACSNLGGLLLARGVAREREFSIRASVGASRSRLVRQLFTESLVLALFASAAGLALGYLVLRALMVWSDAPAWLDPAPDWRVTTFAVAIGFVAAILFGLPPALQATRPRRRAIMRQFLIGAQVAASCVLLIVAGLLVRALERASSVNPGFDYKQVISIDPQLSAHGYSPATARAYLEVLKSRLRALPGVESVSVAFPAPLGNSKVVNSVEIGGRSVDIYVNHIDPEFFKTMKIPLLRGRNLMPGDTLAVVAGESMVRREWPGQDPLGKHYANGADYTVVGVVGSARMVEPKDPDAVEVYKLAGPNELPSLAVLVRTAGPPEGLLPSVATAVKAIDPNVQPEIQLLNTSFNHKLEGVSRSALAVSLLGFIALFIACLGIVGMVAYAVVQRTREIGIRMALGAGPSQVLAVVLRQFSRPVAIGLVIGTSGAALLSQILRRELYGLSNLDPLTYLIAVAIFALTAAVGALLPARRALRVDPMRALRHD
jgi:predicted permease